MVAGAVRVVGTVGVTALTVTVSATPEIFMATDNCTASPIVVMTFSWTMVANPASLNVAV